MRFGPILCVVSSLIVIACGSGSPVQSSTTDAGHDAATQSDGQSDANGGACQETLAAWCAAQTPGQLDFCGSTWGAASTNTKYCALLQTVADCGQYQALALIYFDSLYTYYYDKTSGALVAFVSSSGGSSDCIGGPADFVEPACGSFELGVCEDAGSIEAGAADAGAD